MAQVYIVASGKGGAGKSTVTAGLSAALTERKKKVLCVDADVGSKSLDLILSLGEDFVFSWQDVLSGACLPESALLRAEGVPALLLPPFELKEAGPEIFCLLLEPYGKEFDYIFIDLPPGWSAFSEAAAQAAGKALIVTTPDALCVRSAAFVSEKIGGCLSDVRLIVNRFDREEALLGRQLSLDDCVDRIAAGLIGVIPEDRALAFPPASGKLTDCARGAFERTAARIDGENLPFKSKNL